MLRKHRTIKELNVKKRHQKEADIILEILAGMGDDYFFGVDELKEILGTIRRTQ